jgi:cytochrome c1
MKKISILILAIVFIVGLSSCAIWKPPPPVTAEWKRDATKQHVDLGTLQQGRTLFVNRCIECHTLPSLWRYRVEDWPEIVNSMSHRASLKPAERDAILAYIIAARASL